MALTLCYKLVNKCNMFYDIGSNICVSLLVFLKSYMKFLCHFRRVFSKVQKPG
jgi:hypothetical protein